MIKENFVRMFEDSFRRYWDLEAFTDYETKFTLTYGQVAEQVEKLHLLFEQCGIQKNDRIASAQTLAVQLEEFADDPGKIYMIPAGLKLLKIERK